MKVSVGLSAVILCAVLAGCGVNVETKKFTVTGERIVIWSGTENLDLDAAEDSSVDLATENKAWGQQEISVELARYVGTEKILIASGTFTDDTIVLEGEIEQNWYAPVTLQVSQPNEEPLTLVAWAIDLDVSFAFVDYESPDSEDRLLFVGDSRIHGDVNEEFTISGDVSSITDQDLSLAIAEVRFESMNHTAIGYLATSELLLDDGKFLVEGKATEPILVTVVVRNLDYRYRGLVNGIVEPGAHIKVMPSKSSSSFNPNFASELMANSETEGSLHSKVIESWQNSEEYLAKMDEYATAIEQAAQQTDSDTETGRKDTETTGSDEQAFRDPYDVFKELQVIEFSALTSIAQHLDEPMAALLAMELGARSGLDYSRQLDNWDKLASVLDEDVVARRVVPQRVEREKQILVATNAKSIVEGKMAPEFTLANLDGNDIALYDVLASNEVVLVDFWASWCGPCIDKLPKLKELHTAYSEQGFEIVFVSIDDTYDDWKDGSEKHTVPGVNVGDLHGFLADTPVAYGVQWIPTEFLLNPNGKILDRDLTTDELESFLVDHFGTETKQENSD